jgi:hypothetical protein
MKKEYNFMKKPLFTLGKLFVSDFIDPKSPPRDVPYELDLVMDDLGCVRLNTVAPSNIMYGQYWYRSGITNTMKKELSEIVNSITNLIALNKNDIWIDIACNDGTLLSYVPSTCTRIGIDPADNSYTIESKKHSDLIIQDYFTASAFKKSEYGTKKAKVITTIAMFYDLDNPDQFIQDIHEVLDDNGLWVIQLSYTPLMIEQLAFDNICHEHIYYYSLFNLKKLMNKNGFDIVDVQLNDINGGSFRVYMMKSGSDKTKFGSQPHRDVCNFRINSLLRYESTLKLDEIKTWFDFYNNINDLKQKTVSFIKQEKAKGKVIWGYGASTKGNTLLQYFELDDSLIDGIAERSPFKYGLKTVGTNIPIYSEEEMRKVNPDYLIILPWHFINEFKQREHDYLANGGKFIVPCPKFEIIGL